MRQMNRRGAWYALRAGAVAAVVGLGSVGGATRAAAQSSWGGPLSGGSQVPPNASTGGGFAVLSLAGNALTVDVRWFGLTGGAAAAGHIHCCALPGSNAAIAVPFVSFPTVTTGTYNYTFDLGASAVYTSAFLAANGGTAAGAESALLAGLNGGQAYVNLHNATYPNGEIRANLAPALTTPEPSSVALAATALGGAGLIARRRRR